MLWLLACTSAPPKASPPGASTAHEPAQLVGAADFDGDGVDELVRVQDGVLHWPGGSQEVTGAPQRVARGNLGQGEVVLVAMGMSRDHKGVPLEVWQVGADGAQSVFTLRTPRAQIPTLEIIDGQLWVAVYTDTYTVEGGWVVDGALQPKSKGRLAEAQLPWGDEFLVGRVYGDEPRSDGDLTLHPSGTTLPVFRGVRQVESTDLDGDGDLDLLVGDGWHSNYGQVADGRVLVLMGPDLQQQSVIAHLGADYAAEAMEHDGDDLLVTGPTNVHLLRRDAIGWVDFNLGEHGGNAVLVKTPEGPGVWMAGDPSQVVLR